jgi:hypothetical protein
MSDLQDIYILQGGEEFLLGLGTNITAEQEPMAPKLDV